MTLNHTLTKTYQRFALKHPRWADSLFDEFFLTQHAAPLLQQRIDEGTAISAVDLANLYITQFSWPRPLLNLSLTRLIEVATDFLSLLDEELGPPVGPIPTKALFTAPADAEELGHVLTVYAEVLRDGSNYALDWLWLAAKLPSAIDRRYCLEQALKIDPHSPLVHRALEG